MTLDSQNDTQGSDRAVFLYDERMSEHTLSDTHPMKPVRLRYTRDLLDSYGAFDSDNSRVASAREATKSELEWFHSPDYVNGVEAIGAGRADVNPAAFNFGPGDNPHYPGIYEAASLSTGASVVAAELLIAGEANGAFNIAGGLHHAMPDHAYGFCVFNDPVIAIHRFLQEGMKVAYVDIDCHHGDGVQHAFYATDRVLTISLHESGAFLFPGTGFVQETGDGRRQRILGERASVSIHVGRGVSVGVPSDSPSPARRFQAGRDSDPARHRLPLPRPDNPPRADCTGVRRSRVRVSHGVAGQMARFGAAADTTFKP